MKSVLCWLLLSFACGSFAERVRIGGPQSEFDASHSYYQGLIELAFTKINQPITITYAPYMVQKRALENMKAGRLIDVYWAATDAQREDRYGYVPIPLIKGLLGFRVFALHQDKIKRLKAVDSLSQLKKISLCQGTYWPDTDIMLAAGLTILPSTIYENMFKQVYNQRCDAFPRGINEAMVEVKARQKVMPKLRLYDDLILRYPFAMYFFTKKDNKVLISKITQGLELAIDDGSFDRYLREHPTTEHLFPLSRWINNKRIDISNPFLSTTIDLANKRYWLMPNK